MPIHELWQYLGSPLPTLQQSGFFSDISSSFGSRNIFHLDWSVIALYLATLLVLAIILALLLRFIKNRYWRVNPMEIGVVSEPAEVEDILQTALVQRSRIDVTAKASGARGQTMYCSLDKVGKRAIVLEAPIKYENNIDAWKGMAVECFFKIRNEENQIYYYSLASIVRHILKKNKIVYIMLLRPKKLYLNQKRGFLRIEPAPEFISGLAFWPERITPLEGESIDIRAWGKPLYKYVPSADNHKTILRIQNISAQGIRLEVDNALMRGNGMDFHISDHYLLVLEVFDFSHDPAKKLRFWLRAQVKSRFEDVKKTEVGMKISGYGHLQMTDDGQMILRWIEVGDDEAVPELGDWVMYVHMSEHRQHSDYE